MGWKAEAKECEHQYYGWYCSDAKEKGFEPLSYSEWQKSDCPKKFIKS